MSKKLMLSVVFVASLFTTTILGSSGIAQAHFNVIDEATGMVANFHATPDHSPIAGKESVISYDFSKADTTQAKDFTFSLAINKIREKAVLVPTDITGNVVLADYAFPTRGLYILTLTATPKNKTNQSSVLTYSQRVSRGNIAENKGFGKFEIGVVAVVSGAIGIVFTITFKDNFMRSKRKGVYEKDSNK